MPYFSQKNKGILRKKIEFWEKLYIREGNVKNSVITFYYEKITYIIRRNTYTYSSDSFCLTSV